MVERLGLNGGVPIQNTWMGGYGLFFFFFFEGTRNPLKTNEQGTDEIRAIFHRFTWPQWAGMGEREKPGGDNEKVVARVHLQGTEGLNRRHDNRSRKETADATADMSRCRTRPDSMNSWVNVKHVRKKRLCTSDSEVSSPGKQVEACPRLQDGVAKRKLEMRCWILGQIWMIDIILGVPQHNGKEEWRGEPGGEGRRTWANLQQSVPLEDWGAGSAGKGTGEAAVGTGKSGLDARELPEDGTATSSGCYREVRGHSSVKKVVLMLLGRC